MGVHCALLVKETSNTFVFMPSCVQRTFVFRSSLPHKSVQSMSEGLIYCSYFTTDVREFCKLRTLYFVLCSVLFFTCVEILDNCKPLQVDTWKSTQFCIYILGQHQKLHKKLTTKIIECIWNLEKMALYEFKAKILAWRIARIRKRKDKIRKGPELLDQKANKIKFMLWNVKPTQTNR